MVRTTVRGRRLRTPTGSRPSPRRGSRPATRRPATARPALRGDPRVRPHPAVRPAPAGPALRQPAVRGPALRGRPQYGAAVRRTPVRGAALRRTRAAVPPPPGPPPKSKVGLIAVLTAVALVVIAARRRPGEGARPPCWTPASAERDVAAQFEQREGVAIDLDCPDDMKIRAGATYDCRGKTADGESVTLRLADHRREERRLHLDRTLSGGTLSGLTGGPSRDR